MDSHNTDHSMYRCYQSFWHPSELNIKSDQSGHVQIMKLILKRWTISKLWTQLMSSSQSCFCLDLISWYAGCLNGLLKPKWSECLKLWLLVLSVWQYIRLIISAVLQPVKSYSFLNVWSWTILESLAQETLLMRHILIHLLATEMDLGMMDCITCS
jgi:hypothetical protein